MMNLFQTSRFSSPFLRNEAVYWSCEPACPIPAYPAGFYGPSFQSTFTIPGLEDKHDCPVSCFQAGSDSVSWTPVLSVENLQHCNETLLFKTSIRFPIESPNRQTLIRACTSNTGDTSFVRASDHTCPATAKASPSIANAEIGWWDSGEEDAAQSLTFIEEASQQLQQHLNTLEQSCEETAVFAKANRSVVGVYVDAEMLKMSAGPLIEQFIEFASRETSPTTVAMQVCGHRANDQHLMLLGLSPVLSGILRLSRTLSGPGLMASALRSSVEARSLKTRSCTSSLRSILSTGFMVDLLPIRTTVSSFKLIQASLSQSTAAEPTTSIREPLGQRLWMPWEWSRILVSGMKQTRKVLPKEHMTSNSVLHGRILISAPRGQDDWATNNECTQFVGAKRLHTYHFDDSVGDGQYVYVLEGCFNFFHSVSWQLAVDYVWIWLIHDAGDRSL
ncbi:hypothetical protein BDW62DRAFT_64685 [Aspergillus aurantiobrunneus]